MADDRKKSENICVRVTDRMFIDLNRRAAIEERTQADWLFLIIRHELYGKCGATQSGEPLTSADKVSGE